MGTRATTGNGMASKTHQLIINTAIDNTNFALKEKRAYHATLKKVKAFNIINSKIYRLKNQWGNLSDILLAGNHPLFWGRPMPSLRLETNVTYD